MDGLREAADVWGGREEKRSERKAEEERDRQEEELLTDGIVGEAEAVELEVKEGEEEEEEGDAEIGGRGGWGYGCWVLEDGGGHGEQGEGCDGDCRDAGSV